MNGRAALFRTAARIAFSFGTVEALGATSRTAGGDKFLGISTRTPLVSRDRALLMRSAGRLLVTPPWVSGGIAARHVSVQTSGSGTEVETTVPWEFFEISTAIADDERTTFNQATR
ncbi:hypothetical protein R5W23_001616 [Gemmata sp. JC673]|uniref:Uncharacterized protein n=1 Tax=Gemmata algarum TaxID=2975278 RepID=A0ABU5F0K3_9BACT|nr:hypothetical protein [Gemmata algarum]MDY3560382.1 hypothetical protein [Gemmata algarum]